MPYPYRHFPAPITRASSDRPPTGTPEYRDWLSQPGNTTLVLKELKDRGIVPKMSVAEFEELKYGPERRNIRIDVRDTQRACASAVIHGTVHVEVMGVLYTTLGLTPEQIDAVSRASISWSFD